MAGTLLSTLREWGPYALPFILLLVLMRLRRKSAGRLEQLYPAVPPAPGTRMRRVRVVFGRGPSLTWVKLGVDHAWLHVSLFGTLRRQAAFSVPLEDVTAAADRFAPMILFPDVIRLSFVRDPDWPMLVWPHVFAAMAAASRGRLRVAEESLVPIESRR